MEMHAHTQMESLTQPHIHPVGQCPDCDSARERDFAREREERKSLGAFHTRLGACIGSLTVMLHGIVCCQALKRSARSRLKLDYTTHLSVGRLDMHI